VKRLSEEEAWTDRRAALYPLIAFFFAPFVLKEPLDSLPEESTSCAR